MAEKKVFITSADNYYTEHMVKYTYYSGFAVSQKQKSIASLHSTLKEEFPGKKILEVSTKSTDELGIQLSAFNLKFYHEELGDYRWIENVFQSAKVFENGGPYKDLLNVAPKDAKRDERLTTSGKLKAFNLYGIDWPLEPKTMFYDWIYITALKRQSALAKQIVDYDIFTDIEFNHKKSINCQARAAAIFVSLVKKNELEAKTSSPDEFATIYENGDSGGKQMTFNL